LDAERYNLVGLEFDEIDRLERRLTLEEEMLSLLVADSAKGGRLRAELEAGGHAKRAAVWEQVGLWIGVPASNTPGALNAPPWNVPIGAP
jgi:hypothetical protein